MSFLQLEKLYLQNIRCYHDIEIEFSKGTNIITGENGSGKSTILMSVGFALYGVKYLGSMGISQTDLIRRGTEVGTIELKFSTHEGQYVSTYTLKRGKKSTWIVKQYRGGVKTKEIEESREFIQQVIGDNIDANVFKNALCSAQGELTILLQSAPAERKQQLHQILGIQEYDRTQKHVSRILDKLKDRQIKNSETLEIYSDIGDIDDVISKIKQLKAETTTIDEHQKKIDNSILKINDDIANNEKMEKEANQIDKSIQISEKTFIKETVELTQVQNNINTVLKKLHIEISSENELDLLSSAMSKDEKLLQTKTSEIKTKIAMYKTSQKRIESFTDEISELKSKIKIDQKSLTLKLGDGSLKTLYDGLVKSRSNFEKMKSNHEILSGKIKDNESFKLETIDRFNKLNEKTKEFNQSVKQQFQISPENLESIKKRVMDTLDELEVKEVESDKLLKKLYDMQSRLQNSVSLHLDTISLLEKVHTGSKCPTCQQGLQDLNHEELIKLHNDKSNSFKEQLELLDEEIKIENNQKIKTKSLRASKRKEETSLEKLLALKNDMQSDLPTIKTLEGKIASLEKEISELNNKLTNYSQDAIDKENARLIRLESMIEALSTNESNIGKWTSLKIQAEENRNKLLLEIKEINISSLTEDSTQSELELLQLSSKLKQLLKELKPNFRQQQNLIERCQNIESELEKSRERQKRLSVIFNKEKLTNLRDKKSNLREELGKLKARNTSINEKELPVLISSKQEIEKKNLTIVNLEADHKRVSEALPKLAKVQDVLSALPSHIMNKITNMVSSQLTLTMQRMLPNKGFNKVIFDSTGEVTVSYRGDVIDRKTLSGGEQTVMGVGLRLALAEYVAPLKFMILDEPTVHLDQDRVSEFIEIVDRDDLFTDANGQLIIVTHRDEFNRNAAKTIRIDVQPDGSRVLKINQ